MVSWITNGSLRAKMAWLLVAVAILPLAVLAWWDWRRAGEQLRAQLQAQLEARSDLVARQIDLFHAAYQPDVERLARVLAVRTHCGAPGDAAGAAAVRDLLAAFPAGDERVRGAALLDRAGRVMLSSEPALAGLDQAGQPHVRAVLRGAAAAVSDIHLVLQEPTEKPRIAYLAPVLGLDGRIACVAVLWVRASALWQLLKSLDGLAGPHSHAVLLDARGIRIGDSLGSPQLFRPAGRIEPAVVDVLESQGRFGPGTRGLLDDVHAEPALFERARAAAPDAAMFLSEPAREPGDGRYGVARRCSTLPWTVAYLAPRDALDAPLRQLREQRLVVAGALVVLAYGLGMLFVVGLRRSVQHLQALTTALAGGNLDARMRNLGGDELGRLGQSFNTMAARIQAQTLDLQRARDMFDTRVQVRTAELQRAQHKLEAQAAERKLAERAMHEVQQLLQAIVDHASSVIHVKDLKGRYQIVNRRFLELRQLDEIEVLGKTDHELIPPEVAEPIRAADQRAAAAAQAVYQAERLPHHDGLHEYASVKCALRDRQGQVYGICTISNDITELRQAALRLQHMVDRLAWLDQVTTAIGERSEFAALGPAALSPLEDLLPLDFACLCRLGADARSLQVLPMSVRSTVVAAELGLEPGQRLEVDSSVLWRGVHGELVHEPDLSGLAFPFPQRLVRAGLRALVVVPMYAGSQLLGVLMAARRAPQSFSGNECDFLCQAGTLLALSLAQDSGEARQPGAQVTSLSERLRVVS